MDFSQPPIALAVFAHPDDIEFTCAGTLALLAERGWEVHYQTLADGCLGSLEKGPEAIAQQRWEESQAAAKVLKATPHPPLFADLEVFYNDTSARKVGARIREIQPNVLLTHAVEDYMEDHMNTARLALSALFSAGIPNYTTDPHRPPYEKPRAIYHALPHGLRRPADRQRVYPEFYLNIDSVLEIKRKALACHQSQKEWLDQTQGMDAYLDTMTNQAATLGSKSGAGTHAEGFTRHLHLGLGPEDYTPLEDALKELVTYAE